jgi:short-subunit dehydrogenase
MKVRNKTFVVTGGGNGLGREMVLDLLSRGARVAVVDLNESALAETVELAGDRKDKLSIHVLNITDKAAVEAFSKQLISQHGAVDGLINNAGIIQPFVRLADLDYSAIDRVMNVNFFGTLYMTKAFLPHLLKRPEAHITNISSMGGFLPVPGQTVYGASKAAVKLLTEGLHSELLDTNVDVTVVFPGAMKTNIARHSGAEASLKMDSRQQNYKMVEPSKAARRILDGMEKNRYRILIGSDSKTMDLLYRLNPERAARFIYRQMRSLLPG